MPRFYFNIRSGQTLRQDAEGEEHDTLRAAEEEATASAREIISEAIRTGDQTIRHKAMSTGWKRSCPR